MYALPSNHGVMTTVGQLDTPFAIDMVITFFVPVVPLLLLMITTPYPLTVKV